MYICLLYSWRLSGWLTLFMMHMYSVFDTQNWRIHKAYLSTLLSQGPPHEDSDGSSQHSRVAMEGMQVAQLMVHNARLPFEEVKTLNYKNLLYLQAEIVHLEQELRSSSTRELANWTAATLQGLVDISHATWSRGQHVEEILKIRNEAGEIQ